MSEIHHGLPWRHGHGRDAEHMEHEQAIEALVDGHARIERQTEYFSWGLRARTTSVDPGLAAEIRRHTRRMAERFGKGRAIRSWDPLFAALFEQRERIHLRYEDLADGVLAELRAEAPEVVALIHAHGVTLERMVAQGRAQSAQPSPMPPVQVVLSEGTAAG